MATTAINVPSTVMELHSPTTSLRAAVSTVVDNGSDNHRRSTTMQQPRVSLTVASRINHTVFVSLEGSNGRQDAMAPRIVLDDVTDALDDVIHVDGTRRHLVSGDNIRNSYDDDMGNSCDDDDVTMAVTYRYHGDAFEERRYFDPEKVTDVEIDESNRSGNYHVDAADRKEIDIHTSTDNDVHFEHDVNDPPFESSNGIRLKYFVT